MSRRHLAALSAAALLITTPAALAATSDAAPPGAATTSDGGLPRGSEEALVRLQLPDRAALEELVVEGADIAAVPAAAPDSRGDVVLVDLVLTGDELDGLLADGATVQQVIQREGDAHARWVESREAAEARRAEGLTLQRAPSGEMVPLDTLTVDHAAWWESSGQTFLQVQVDSSAGTDPSLQIAVEWETGDGATGTFQLARYVDAGEYLFHYSLPVPVPAQPVSITVTSNQGGAVTAAPTAWPGADGPELPEGYQHDFIDSYLTPAEIDERIDRLAEQYPDLVDVIELPDATNGYRRTAKAIVGDPAAASIVVESLAYGSDGLNGTEVVVEAATEPDQPLAADYQDDTLTVTLATDATGAVTSTTTQVSAYLNEQFPETFSSFVVAGRDGFIMLPAEAVLGDGLQGTDEVEQEAGTVRLMRIGHHRDGTRPAVFAYSQEHAREWVTPLVTMEFAERMLANAQTDEETGQLLEEVEILVLPVVNPDGANYSFYDRSGHRRNMSEHCEGTNRDPRQQNNLGVDVNRNYGVGSVFDGYVGGSLNCLSDTFAGTGELSEAEARNVVAVAEMFPNITHALNVHSYGGYFMWSPGAYRMPGREPLPVPSPEVAAEFVDASQRVIAAISAHRGTVTWPSNTGPVVDVLYSAAGNSGDHLFYEFDIYAWDFEVGNDLWSTTNQRWEGVGFQPPFAEAHPESQEYAEGLVELVRIAADAGPVTRLSGPDRYETAIEIGRTAFPDSTSATLVSGAPANLVDGLVAAPLAYAQQEPLLVTAPDRLPNALVEELTARGVSEVTVVGGDVAVNQAVVEELEALDIEVTRVAGTSRYETAAQVATLVGGDRAVIASGEAGHLVDALGVSGPAATDGTPVLLVRADRVPVPTADWLESADSTLVVGGSGAISDDVLADLPDPQRVSGVDRWATATAVADHFVAEGLDVSSVAVASGEDDHLIDALPGGTLGEVILLSRSGSLPSASTAWLEASADTEHAWVLGGEGAVAAEVMDTLRVLLSDW